MINSMGKGRRMKLSFDACMFAVLLVLCTPGLVMSGMAADPSADPQGDRARELHKELAKTRGSPDGKPITFKVTTDSSSVLMFAKPCTGGTTNDVSFTVNDGDGHPIVSINECTGKVTVTHPERMDEQAREFWRTLQKAWPDVCAPPPKAPKK